MQNIFRLCMFGVCKCTRDGRRDRGWGPFYSMSLIVHLHQWEAGILRHTCILNNMEVQDYFETTTSSSNSPCLLSTDASSLGSSLVSKTFKQKQSWNKDSSLTAQVLGLAWVCLSVSNTWIPLDMLRSSCCKNGIANPHEICLHFLSALPLFPILPLYCTCKQTWEVLKDLLGISSLRNWDTTLNFPKASFPKTTQRASGRARTRVQISAADPPSAA